MIPESPLNKMVPLTEDQGGGGGGGGGGVSSRTKVLCMLCMFYIKYMHTMIIEILKSIPHPRHRLGDRTEAPIAKNNTDQVIRNYRTSPGAIEVNGIHEPGSHHDSNTISEALSISTLNDIHTQPIHTD